MGYRVMRIFLKRYGYKVSNTTMHKYMNKHLILCAVIMRSKPGYKTGNKHKIFDNVTSFSSVEANGCCYYGIY